MTISPFLGDGAFDAAQLDGEQAVYESELVRHVRFTEPLYIYVDGRKNKGIIRKDDRKDKEAGNGPGSVRCRFRL